MATILYAEDCDMIREMNKELLELEGHKVLEAANGKIAVELFNHHGSEISVVITDLDMPEMAGDELVDVIRCSSSELPLYVLSGSNNADRITKLLLKGANGYFEKPVEIEKLLKVIPITT